MPIPMVSHSELVITVLPGDENTAIKNCLEGNRAVSKLPPHKPVARSNFLKSLCQFLIAVQILVKLPVNVVKCY